jgi:hypothetical protein
MQRLTAIFSRDSGIFLFSTKPNQQIDKSTIDKLMHQQLHLNIPL